MLTDLQARILDFIRDYLKAHGRAPTLTEIGAGVGVSSKGTVHRYVKALTDKGYLERHAHSWRGLRLVESGATESTLPLQGRIAAGRPIEAIPGQDEVDLGSLFNGVGRYVLEVRGDSMIEAGILDGDMVVIEQCDSAEDGAIVVALIDDEEATLKRLARQPSGDIELIPANAAMQTLVYAPERVRIQGRLVGQLRRYG